MTTDSPVDTVAQEVLRQRYLQQDETGQVVETPDELFQRVAANLGQAETAFGGNRDGIKADFYTALRELDFLPNSPTLMNAGTDVQQLAACFVLPIEDSLASIFETLKQTALVHQSGGGTGFAFSRLRPHGDIVQRTGGGGASSPVSFMTIFDAATEQIKQGGRRRGANMGVLNASHPDIEQFITIKEDHEEALRNFNLSVATPGEFWEAYANDEEYALLNPRTKETVATVDPEHIIDQIAEAAWASGDPGVLFFDRINDANPFPVEGPADDHWIDATNPYGELPLEVYEPCVLGSINLGRMTADGEVDWEKLAETVRLGVRFLDNAVTMSEFPMEAIAEKAQNNRKIGLGVMGFHDMLVDLELPYHSEESVAFAEELMSFINETAWEMSKQLADERGAFPNWDDAALEEKARNATTTTIAPTGSISLIAGCSASIEPIYNVAYTKHVMGGLDIVNDRFVELANERGFYSDDLLDQIRETTSIQDFEGIPADIKELFPTAHDIAASHHVRIQAAFQENVDNAVSKTVNLPADATDEDIKQIVLEARERGCKGTTVFRSGAKRDQVLGREPRKEECIGECDYVE